MTARSRSLLPAEPCSAAPHQCIEDLLGRERAAEVLDACWDHDRGEVTLRMRRGYRLRLPDTAANLTTAVGSALSEFRPDGGIAAAPGTVSTT
jgi:hypothetical protein